MPDMRKPPQAVVGILCSDIHLRLKPPPARSREPNWLAAMARYLTELKSLAEQYNAPVFCAGDIFDYWNSAPELINFAIKFCPAMFAIPGQHDLPHHNYADIRKTAYWTLAVAGTLTPLPPNKPALVGNVRAWGFPWGYEITPLAVPKIAGVIDLAVIHSYIWYGKHKHPGAEENKAASVYHAHLAGYDASVWGDNHAGFQLGNLINTGSFMRMHTDQIDYKPMVGLLYGTGRISPHYLDISRDVIDGKQDVEVKEQADAVEIQMFLKSLLKVSEGTIDFKKAVREYVNKSDTSKAVRDLLLEVIEQ